jgi:hypothetical protein
MHRKKLPIGIQTFRKIREDDYYYADKYRAEGHPNSPDRCRVQQ